MKIITEHVKDYMKVKGLSGIKGIITLILRQLRVHFFLKLGQILPHPYLRVLCFRCIGVNIGKEVFIGLDVIMDTLFPELITIEDYAEIGDRACIYTHSRGTLPLKKIYPLIIQPVKISRGAWIGAPNVTILPGVTIGEYSIIAAGAVVVKNVPKLTVFGGVPAKKIKNIDQSNIIMH